MAGTISVRSDFPIFMTPAGQQALRRQVWDAEDKEISDMRSLYFNVEDTEDAFYQSYGTIGLGRAVRKPEGTPKRLDNPALGRVFTLVFPTYALAVAISRELQEDDKNNQLVPFITRELKKSIFETMEEDAASQLNNGFTYQGWETDGVALFSTAHPYIRNQSAPGTLQYGSNRSATDAALSITSLDAAYTALRTVRNDTGRWLSEIMPEFIDVAPANLPTSLVLVGTRQVLGSNNNDINLYYNQLKPRSNPRITDNNCFYLSGKQHSWIWKNRRGVEFKTKTDDISDVTILMTSARWGRGAEDWRGKYGSAGPA